MLIGVACLLGAVLHIFGHNHVNEETNCLVLKQWIQSWLLRFLGIGLAGYPFLKLLSCPACKHYRNHEHFQYRMGCRFDSFSLVQTGR